jgi:hypothetical protein
MLPHANRSKIFICSYWGHQQSVVPYISFRKASILILTIRTNRSCLLIHRKISIFGFRLLYLWDSYIVSIASNILCRFLQEKHRLQWFLEAIWIAEFQTDRLWWCLFLLAAENISEIESLTSKKDFQKENWLGNRSSLNRAALHFWHGSKWFRFD